LGTNQPEDEGSQDLTSYPTILSIQMLTELGSQVPYPERQYDVARSVYTEISICIQLDD